MLNTILAVGGLLAIIGLAIWAIASSRGKKATGVKNVIEFPGEEN
jgi:hypothetical protein